MSKAYYNDNDPKICDWLKKLIQAKLIANGDVDSRSIVEVQPSDLEGYTQCHFFAGIGGWSLALQLAGWPADRPVWTGSCPCQPFSTAGTQKGVEDPRHLWPEFRRLIAQCKPPEIFGEQVASKLGRYWLAAVRDNLETLGYAVGGSDLCAAGVGAFHTRQRLFWAASRNETVGNSVRYRGSSGLPESKTGEEGFAGISINSSSERFWNPSWGRVQYKVDRDGYGRPVNPDICLLADGVSNRVGLLRGYGNAIVPQVGAVFVRSFMEAPLAQSEQQ